MFVRAQQLPPPGTETFFLWGPRQAGKSTLLRQAYPEVPWVDLLKAEEFRSYLQHPERLREELKQTPEVDFVVIDEIQKVPALLDEIHWLHENRGMHFALCGSSARKVRRGGANLLGGRAVRRILLGLTAHELGDDWDLGRALNHGFLPRIYSSDKPQRLLSGYVADYLKEEVAAEGLVRNLPVFSEFLEIAALADGDQVNLSNIARECGVSSHTVKGYFEILSDTLLGRWLPAYRKRPKRRIGVAPKFYFNDVGVVSFLARRGPLQPGSELFGKALESWCLHEMTCYEAYRERFAKIAFWRLSTGTEVDFVVNDLELAVEVKSARLIASQHLKGLRALAADHPGVGKRLLVCLEQRPRTTSDGIEILPVNDFVGRLWNGELF